MTVERVAGEIQEALITEEGLAKLRALEGTKLRPPREFPFNETANKDSIRHFAWGVGDENPLWLDEAYAKKTRYGAVVAPPSWLYSTIPTIQHGLPGVHAFHSGDDWTFYKPVVEGDDIEAEFISGRVVEVPGHFSDRMLRQYDTVNYYNKKTSEKVAEREKWAFRTERRSAKKTGKYSQIQLPHPWTDEELGKIDEEVVNEFRRGSEVRFWEDVEIGEEMPKLVKGPIGGNSELSWYAGCCGFGGAYAIPLRDYVKHPAWGIRDPEVKCWNSMGSVHWEVRPAKAAGLPYPYALGICENSWLIQALTNWMGDEGWLKKCYAEYRRFVYFSDVVRFGGKVSAKYVDEDGEFCVDIETNAINQRNENCIPGKAVISLPSRDAGYWPVAGRKPAK